MATHNGFNERHRHRVPSAATQLMCGQVTTQPELLLEADGNLAGIGSALNAATAAGAAQSTRVIPAAADEVPGLKAEQLATDARMFQAAAAQATVTDEQFVVADSADSYASSEAAPAAATT